MDKSLRIITGEAERKAKKDEAELMGLGTVRAEPDILMPEELKQYRRMMMEANTQLGLVKLPRSVFGKYENLIKATQYEMFKEQIGEDPLTNYKRQLISIQNIKARGVMIQRQDGSVTSLEEVPLIADQIKYMQLQYLYESEPQNRPSIIKQMLAIPPLLLTNEARLELDKLQQATITLKDGKYYDMQGNLVSKDQLRPTLSSAINMDPFGGQSALDVMNESEEADRLLMGQMPTIDGSNPNFPPELVGKTIEQIKAMGAEEIGHIDFKPKKNAFGIHPDVSPTLAPDQEEEMRKALRELENEDDDPEYFLDDMSGTSENFKFMNGPEVEKRRKMEEHHRILKQVKQIDDQAIAIIIEALKKGVPMDDPTY
jgi:hypothetical protein